MHNPRHWLRAAGLWIALCQPGSAAVGNSQLPPADAFASIPAISQVAMSPDGNMLAWSDGTGTEPRVVMFDLKAGKYTRSVKIETGTKLRSVEWADGETALISVSVTLDRGMYGANQIGADRRHWEVYRTLAVDTTGTAVRMLLMDDRDKREIDSAQLVSLHTQQSKMVLMASLEPMPGAVNQNWKYSLFEVDTRNGRGRVLQAGTQYTIRWIADRQVNHVARAEVDATHKRFAIQLHVGDAWRDIYQADNGHPLNIHAFSADGTAIIATGQIGDSRAKMWSIPLDGSPPRVLVEDSDEDVVGAELDSDTGTVLGAWIGGANPNPVWIDSGTQRRQQVLTRSFPGQQVSLEGYSEATDRALACVFSGSHPPVYYVVDFKTHEARMVGEQRPRLAGAALGEVKEITYQARDGQSIPAYLTLPVGMEAHNLPLIVLPHGGLQGRDWPGSFDWLAQFLVNRGYAVIKPQFRGSGGFGEAFRKAGYKQWGGLIQDDVTDAVNAMVAGGIADPKRVCIMGLNYAGYTALAGAAFTPQLYKCAISINGVSNLPEMSTFIRERGFGTQAWAERVGDWTDPKLAAGSPEHAASHIRAPVLLIHATEDSEVPLRQSEGMSRALKAAGKPVVFVPLPGDDHWLSLPESRIRMLQEVEKFLSANL